MSALNRKWGSMRLYSLEEWIHQWEMPEMYAGAGKQGAEDAWYQTMIDLELLQLDGTAYCGGTADIMKFFDQILRPLVYELLRVAGMPEPILDAYRRFQEGLKVHNSLAGSIGHAYVRTCSIPQGCPLSMMIVAIMMRPWLSMIKEMGLQPKVLADDVLVLAQGKSMLSRLARGLNATHVYLQAMGPK
jgi:hypothetical protein